LGTALGGNMLLYGGLLVVGLFAVSMVGRK
jgi:hypothetical protein